MEKEIMSLVDRIVHIGERHGVASLKMDHKEMQRLADEYSAAKDEIRKLVRPSQTAIGTLMHQMQQTKQQLLHKKPFASHPYLMPFEEEEEEEEPKDTEIEFSL